MLQSGPSHLRSVEKGPPPSEFFEIRIATRPLPIRIEYAAIRILHSVMAAQDQSLGLLLGTPSPEALLVNHCEPLPRDAATTEGFTKAWSTYPAQRVVGFFRTQAAGWPEMRETDRDIARRCFHYPGSLFLLIQTPAHRPWSAALFDLDAEGVSPTKTPALEFFFDEYLLRSGYSTAPVPEPEQQALMDPPPARRWNYRVAVAVLGGVLLLGVIGYQWFAGRDRGESASVLPAASPLALKVVRVGQDFEVSWDHLAPAVQQASGGSVTVRDGEITRTVPLNTAQLREGRILYTPLFGDLNVRLEIQQGARTQAESVQVLSWNANSASALLANLPATLPVSVLPPRSAPPSSPARPSPGRAAADAPASPMTGNPQTPVVPSTPTPVAADSKRVFVPPQAVARPPADQEISQAKSSAIVPPPLPLVVPIIPAPKPSSSLDKPAEVKSPAVPSLAATGAGAPSGGPQPPAGKPVEKPAVPSNPVAPPVPVSAPPSASSVPVSVPQPVSTRTPSSDPTYMPPVAVTRAAPKVTREVKRALNLAGGQVSLSVRVSVDTDGNVKSAEVLPQSGTSTFVDFLILKSAALDAANHWKFRPGTLNGKVIASDVTLEFRFQ